MEINKKLADYYDNQYNSDIREWRHLSSKYKSKNIINICQGFKYNKVLDYGAGEGSIIAFLSNSELFGSFTAVDISESAVETLKNLKIEKLIEIIKIDGYELPFQSNSFDLAYCSHVIEHLEYPRKVLKELQRVSKRQIFEIPLDYFIDCDKNINHFLDYGHIDIYTPTTFRFLLKSEGFRIIKDIKTIIQPEIQKYLLNNEVKNPFIKNTKYISKYIKYKLKRIIRSRKWFEEYGYSNYTVMTECLK